MNAIKRFGDYAVSLTESTADDEYQREMLHRANTVAMEVMLVPSGLAFAVLAWAIEGPAAMFALFALLPMVAAVLVGQWWLKNYAPRPRWRNMFTPMFVVYLPLAFVGLAGIAYNWGDGAVTRGMVAGFFGALVVLPFIAPFLVRRQRQRDERRLDAQLED